MARVVVDLHRGILNVEQWKIHKDRAKCEQADCPLQRSAEFYVVLELPDCVRRELCVRCFQEREASRPIYWKAQRAEDKPREPVLDLASLRQLFDRLGEPDFAMPERDSDDGAEDRAPTDVDGARTQRTAADLRYLVALLLLRKRLLRMVDAATPEQEAADLVVVDPKVEGMEPVCLDAPELDSDRLGSLKTS